MNDATLEYFRGLADQMAGPAPRTWQWIGPHMSQRMFGITEERAKAYTAKHGGEAKPLDGMVYRVRLSRCRDHVELIAAGCCSKCGTTGPEHLTTNDRFTMKRVNGEYGAELIHVACTDTVTGEQSPDFCLMDCQDILAWQDEQRANSPSKAVASV